MTLPTACAAVASNTGSNKNRLYNYWRPPWPARYDVDVAEEVRIPAAVIKKRINYARSLCVAGLAVAAVLVVVWTPRIMDPSRWIYASNYDSLEAIVAKLRVVPTDVARLQVFSIDKSLDPSTLRPIDGDVTDTSTRYEVSSAQYRKGQYFVEFLLDPRGHLGLFGLIYSDAPPNIVNRGEYRVIEYSSFLPVLTGHASGKWWYARDLGG